MVSTYHTIPYHTLPMERYNYPTFLNVYQNFMYIPISFLYILPTSYFGWFNQSIPRSHICGLTKTPFLIMGALDSISTVMHLLASVYLPGKLLVLLPQVAIPLSMLASRVLLGERFTKWQYMGATVVLCGIAVVLFPVMNLQHAPEYTCQAMDPTHGDCHICQMETTEEACLSHGLYVPPTNQDKSLPSSVWAWSTSQSDALSLSFSSISSSSWNCQWVSKEESVRHDDVLIVIWSIVLVASCIPMVLSSIYKQVAVEAHLDPILVNGWVAIFQFVCSVPLAIPAGWVSSPRVPPQQLPDNWIQGSQCLFADTNSIHVGCHPDDCVQALVWVHLGLLCSVVYTMSVIGLLKYGSSSLLYLALTVMVPLSHLIFATHAPATIRIEDVIGLLVLLIGLLLYRFGNDDDYEEEEVEEDTGGLSPPSTDNGAVGEGDTLLDESTSPNNQNNNHNNSHRHINKGGYYQFLREPFLLQGDV